MNASPWAIIADCVRRGWQVKFSNGVVAIWVGDHWYGEIGDPEKCLRRVYREALEANP